MVAPDGGPGSRENVSIWAGKFVSEATQMKSRSAPAFTVLSGMKSKLGAVFGVESKLAERGVALVRKYMDAPPSGKRPWPTSVNCGPNLIASITVPSGAKRPMASPLLERAKLAWMSRLVGLLRVGELSAQTSK